MDKPRVALVTGGNRGIGLEACRQLAQKGLKAVLCARDIELGSAAAKDLQNEGLDVIFEQMDVADEESVRDCAGRLEGTGIHIDVLVNNAAIYPQQSLLSIESEVIRETVDANFLGAFWTSKAFVPAMLARGYGRIVNLSSGYGSFGEGLHGPPAYSITKASLNALTVKLAAEVSGDVKVNSMCPGWVRTRMGGPSATRSVEESVDTLIWLATLPENGPNGGFFRDRKRIPW